MIHEGVKMDRFDFDEWFKGRIPEYDDMDNVGSIEDIAIVAWNAGRKNLTQKNAEIGKLKAEIETIKESSKEKCRYCSGLDPDDDNRYLVEEITRLKAEIKQIHEDCECELGDPDGTVWEHAEKLLMTEIPKLKKQLESLLKNCDMNEFKEV